MTRKHQSQYRATNYEGSIPSTGDAVIKRTSVVDMLLQGIAKLIEARLAGVYIPLDLLPKSREPITGIGERIASLVEELLYPGDFCVSRRIGFGWAAPQLFKVRNSSFVVLNTFGSGHYWITSPNDLTAQRVVRRGQRFLDRFNHRGTIRVDVYPSKPLRESVSIWPLSRGRGDDATHEVVSVAHPRNIALQSINLLGACRQPHLSRDIPGRDQDSGAGNQRADQRLPFFQSTEVNRSSKTQPNGEHGGEHQERNRQKAGKVFVHLGNLPRLCGTVERPLHTSLPLLLEAL